MSEAVEERFERLRGAGWKTAGSGSFGEGAGFLSSLRAIVAQRQLLGLLVRRDIKARYKDSALGLLWTLINPIVQLLVYFVVMGKVLGAAANIPDFAIYVFSGLTLYGFFAEILSSTTGSIVNNAGLVRKVYVPREIFPLSSVGAASFTSGVQVIVLLAACILLGAAPFHAEIVYFLPAVAIVVLYGTGLGLLLCALNVYLRDVQYLIQVVLMLALWSSPIVYGWNMVTRVFSEFNLPGWALEIYTNNPLTLAVLGFRKAFWMAGPSTEYPADLPLRMLICIAIGLVIVWVCHRVFTRLQGNFAQEL